MKLPQLFLRDLFCLLLLTTPLVAWPAEPAAAKLPNDLARIVAWLPADTESLIVARSFELGERMKGPADLKPDSLKWLFYSLALGDFYGLDDKIRAADPQKKVKLAVCGGRKASIVSSFGSVRKECCSIIVLETPLAGNVDKWKDALRAKAKRTRTIGDQEVFVFPSFTVMEPVFKLKEWQGLYVSWLAPDTILCATSDRYLEELLQRRKASPKNRALPADLPEWQHIDITAPAWMLWHPAADERSVIAGGGWMWRDDRFEFVYVPKRDAAEVEQAWHARWDDKPLFPHPKPGESLLQRRAGAIIAPVATKSVDGMQAFLFALAVPAFEADALQADSKP